MGIPLGPQECDWTKAGDSHWVFHAKCRQAVPGSGVHEGPSSCLNREGRMHLKMIEPVPARSERKGHGTIPPNRTEWAPASHRSEGRSAQDVAGTRRPR